MKTLKQFLSYKLDEKLLLLLIFLLPLSCSTHFRDYYVLTKWAVLTIFSCFFILHSAIKYYFLGTTSLPRIERNKVIFLAITFFIFLIQNFYHGRSTNKEIMLDLGIFISLFLVFYQNLLQNSKRFLFKTIFANFISSLIISISAYFQIITNLSNSIFRSDYSLFFGNTNMMAQYMGLSLIGNFWLYEKIDKKRRKLFALVLILHTNYLFIQNCRSILLSLFIVSCYCLLKKSFSKTIPKVFFSVLVFHLLFSLLPVDLTQFVKVPPKDTSKVASSVLSEEKLNNGSTTYIRMKLWKASFKMIGEKPFFGWGKDSFSFSSIPFIKEDKIINEKLYFNNPHNEFLRFFTEHGIIIGFAVLLFFFYIFIKLFTSKEEAETNFLQLFFIVFSIETIFQFPFFNATSYLFFILFIAVLAHKFFQPHEIKLGKAVSPALLILFVVSLSFTYHRINSHLAFASKSGLKNNEYVCENWSSYWLTCLKKARSDLRYNRVTNAISILDHVLEEHPFHFTALHLRAIAGVKQNNMSETCYYSKKYDSIFLGKSRLSEFVRKSCK